MPHQRHVPLRRCVSCGTQFPKRELVRIVRTPEDRITVGAGYKTAGRGAYVCHSAACWEQIVKKNRLEHALRVHMLPEDKQELINFANAMAHKV